MKALLIAEKPDLARHVQAAYKNKGFKDQITFKAFHGHIMGLYSPDEYDERYKKWALETLPIIPEKFLYKAIDKDTFNALKNEIKSGNYDYLINCCDPEREGQLIFYSFYEAIKCKLPVKRMWHADLTENELIRALNNMEDDLNTPRLANLTSSSKLRAEIDWLIGMNASRAVSIKRNSLTRIGRVIIPTLEILAKREEEIKNFVPKTVYYPQATLETKVKEKFIAYCDDIIFDKAEECNEFTNKLKGQLGTVVRYSEKKEKVLPPQYLSTADLQAEANKCYGFTLQETLNIMQSLYDKQILSYPRVECNHITKNVAVAIPEIIKLLSNISNEYDNLVRSINKDRVKSIMSDKRYVDDSKVTSHYAISFTGKNFTLGSLTDDEKCIIDIVARNLIASLYDPYEYLKLSADIDIDKNIFHASGKKTKCIGWRNIYDYENDDEFLPTLKQSEICKVIDSISKERTSVAPPRYNDASIIKAMINAGKFVEDKELAKILKGVGDSGGIGRPSTRAAIVEKLVEPIKSKNGEYYLVTRKGKSFYVTDKGMELAKSLEKFSFSSPTLTAIWEQKLLNVEDGTMSSSALYKEVVQYTKDMCNELINSNFKSEEKITNNKFVENVTCPICGGKIKETDKYYLCEKYGKNETDCKFVLRKEINSAKIKEKDLISICDGKKSSKLKMKSQKTGNKYEAYIQFDKETKSIKLILENTNNTQKTDYLCPTCKHPMVKKESRFKKGEYYLTCENKHNIPLVFCDYTLQEEDINALLNGDKTKQIDTFKSKSGKTFAARLFINEEGKLELEFAKN